MVVVSRDVCFNERESFEHDISEQDGSLGEFEFTDERSSIDILQPTQPLETERHISTDQTEHSMLKSTTVATSSQARQHMRILLNQNWELFNSYVDLMKFDESLVLGGLTTCFCQHPAHLIPLHTKMFCLVITMTGDVRPWKRNTVPFWNI